MCLGRSKSLAAPTMTCALIRRSADLSWIEMSKVSSEERDLLLPTGSY